MHALNLDGAPVGTAGTWSLETGLARFTPRFRPVPGTAQAVLGRAGGAGGRWTELTRVQVPEVDLVPSTRIVGIDPGADSVPENLLRFSVTFSAPMDEGSAAGRLQLLGHDGVELAGGLLPMPPELWDRPRRRLTVLLEPGRIKRGLQPNARLGPPLTAGSSVTLVIDRELRDAGGAPLVAGAARTYRVIEPIRSRVDPEEWDIHWPGPDGGPLVASFGRSLDRALVRRCLTVVGAGGDPVAGQVSLDRDASIWTFTPAAVHRGEIGLHIDPDLEDLAGNSVRRVFDRDLREPPGDSPTSTVVLTRRR